MTHFEKAIKLAVEEGGYEGVNLNDVYMGFYSGAELVIDSSFWQALGKALGWPEKNKIGNESCYSWKNQGLEYFDLLLTGGNLEEYWLSLISKK